MGNTALEASTESPAIRAVCDQSFRSWEAEIAARLVEEGMDHDEAARFATFVLSTIEGSLLLARARRDTAPIEEACELLAQTLERQRAVPSSAGSARSSRRTAVSQ